jgi:hypothetical protein
MSNPTATVNVQPGMEKTRDYFAMQTIIAHEQITNTPTPAALSNTPTPGTISNTPEVGTEITTKTATLISTPQLAIASVAQPTTPILTGPDNYNYRISCYIDKGVQLLITGRNIDSSWLKVNFGQGQTCFRLDTNSVRTDIIPDPTMQLWISHSSCTISGDLSGVAIITPTP